MADTLRIGYIGAGGICRQRHLPGFAKIEGVEQVAVANRSVESGNAIAEEYGLSDVHDDWRDLVSRDDLDIIVIGTWPYLHRDLTSAALISGKHVFCQARMTMNLEDARHMYELSQLTDRVTAICPPPHVMPVDKLVKKLLGEGFLGELRHVRLTSLSGSGRDPERAPTWRERRAYSGLNAMAMGIWAEVLNDWVGPCTELWANNRVWVDERPNGLGGRYRVSIPDSVTVLATLADNRAQGLFQWSNVACHGGPDRIELYGSEGTIIHEAGSKQVLAGRAGDDALTAMDVPPELAHPWTVEENFIQAIRDGVPVQTSFADGLAYMEFVEAVYRAHESGGVVRLPVLT